MKAIRHQITRAKREMVVLLLMLAVSAAALTTGVATAQSPTGAEAAAVNPCEGLSPLTMIVSLPTLDSSGGLTKETTDPSGECTFALTLTSVRSAQGVADNSSAACTVTATPTPKGDRGVSAAVQVSGDCQGVQVASRVTLAHSSGPAIPAGVSVASATVPHRVVTAQIGARQPYGERFYHGVRAHWTRSGNYVRVLRLVIPAQTRDDTWHQPLTPHTGQHGAGRRAACPRHIQPGPLVRSCAQRVHDDDRDRVDVSESRRRVRVRDFADSGRLGRPPIRA